MEVVLHAASTACPRVRGLVFLGGSPVMGLRPERAEMKKLNRALAQALRQWHDANGGLRLLMAPCWARYDDNAHTEVLRSVASFCPLLEFFPTWEYEGITRSNQATPREVPLRVWTKFYRRCTALRELSWNLCVFSPAHVKAFVASPKPQLESLIIEHYIEVWKKAPEFTMIQSVLASVPSLRSLKLTLADGSDAYAGSDEDDEEDGDDEDDGEEEEEQGDENDENDQNDEDNEVDEGEGEEVDEGDEVTEEGEMEPVVGCGLDEMVLSVSIHCPQLETFKCSFVCDDGDFAISGKPLAALANLASLRELHVDRCDLERNAIVEIITSVVPSKSTARVIDLEITKTPHAAISSALTFLASQPATRFLDTKLDLSVHASGYAREADEEDAEMFHTPDILKIKERYALAKCGLDVEETDDKMDALTLKFNMHECEVIEEEEEEPALEQPPPIRRSARRG